MARLQPVALPAAGSKLLNHHFFARLPGLPGKSRRWIEAGEHTLEQKGVRVLWVTVTPSKSRETTA